MTLHASTVARGFICIAACWLALARAEYVDPAVRLLAPLENEKLPDSNIPFHFRKEHDPSVSFSVVVFLDGHQVISVFCLCSCMRWPMLTYGGLVFLDNQIHK